MTLTDRIEGSPIILEGFRLHRDRIALTLDGRVYISFWGGEWKQVAGPGAGAFGAFGDKLKAALWEAWSEAGFRVKAIEAAQ